MPDQAAPSSPARGTRPRRAAAAPLEADPAGGGLFAAGKSPAVGRRRPVLPPGDVPGGDRALGIVAELLARARSTGEPAPPPLTFEQAVSRLAEICSALVDPDGRGVVPECLTFEQAAAYLGCSRSKLYSMHDAGLTPAPVELGDGCKRFVRRELFAWLLANCPPRVRWVAMRDAVLRRVA